jgi:hypothetical protein
VSVAIVCLIATWRGEQLLAEAVASAAPHVDHVVLLDGAYAGLDPSHCPAWSDVRELGAALDGYDNVTLYGISHPPRPWKDEITKRNVLLELGRAHVDVAPQGLYALVLDEDELLVHGEQLREYLEWVPRDARAIPGLYRVEPDGTPWWAPSRLFFLSNAIRYAGRSYYLRAGDGTRWTLEHDRGGPYPFMPDKVHVRHQWDRRSPARAAAQREWGRRLAELDHGPTP